MARKEFELITATNTQKTLITVEFGGLLAGGFVGLNVLPAENITLKYMPPEGTIAIVKSVYINIAGVAGATGEHRLTIGSGAQVNMGAVNPIYVSKYMLDPTNAYSADTYKKKFPTDDTAFAIALKDMVCDRENGLEVTYYNKTNLIKNFWNVGTGYDTIKMLIELQATPKYNTNLWADHDVWAVQL